MRRAGRRAWSALPVLAAVLSIALLSCAGLLPPTPGFYETTPAERAGPPGSLIRTEPMVGAPLDAAASRILYRSVGLQGEPIAVSGVLVVPPGPAPAGGRPIVAWAHPTTGVVPACGPSRSALVFQMIQGVREMVRRGYAVVATDYPGLGTPGPHPYLVGVSEGRAVLDSVRAARQALGDQAGDRFAAWGHSQGGHAALYTGLLARDYAPELRLVGVAAAAPATELGTLLNDDIGTLAGKNITAMTLWSWTRVFQAPLAGIVDAEALPVIDRLAEECIESPLDIPLRRMTSRSLQQRFLTVSDFTAVEPWSRLLRANTPGVLPRDIPVFIAQGSADTIVRPAVTEDYRRRLCQAGSAVRMLVLPGEGHGLVAAHAAIPAVDWMTDRFAGRAAPSDC